MKFCRDFEEYFKDELKYLLEYKLEVQTIATYSTVEETHSTTALMKFTHLKKDKDMLTFLAHKVEEFTEIKSITLHQEWVELEGKALLTEEQADRMLSISTHLARPQIYAKCHTCAEVIYENDPCALCKECQEPLLICFKCAKKGRDFYY